MNKYRKHGNPPFNKVLLHGGPGAPGGMAPVAKKLSETFSVLEPFQTMDSIEGQVEELKDVIEGQSDIPVILIGFSWGAWLGFIFTAKHQDLIKKLILVSSGPFEKEYAEQITKIRLDRLTKTEKEEIEKIIKVFKDTKNKERNTAFARFGELFSKADTFDAMEHDDNLMEFQSDIFNKVWPTAEKLRASGELLRLGHKIKCPVTAIHGDYDPHPYQGVMEPLSKILKQFKFYLLEKCGHEPWIEKYAYQRFYKILISECDI